MGLFVSIQWNYMAIKNESKQYSLNYFIPWLIENVQEFKLCTQLLNFTLNEIVSLIYF